MRPLVHGCRGRVNECSTPRSVRNISSSSERNCGPPVVPEFQVALNRRQLGVAAETTFDALGRAVRQDFPNGTYTETTIGPWIHAL